MRITNMKTSKGNKVANQFVIDTENGQYFQSYNTVIAFKPSDGSTLTLDFKSWDYSKTTSKYRNIFTGLTTAETKRMINDGSIILDDLNK